MNLKKFFAAAMAVVIAASLFAGCGEKQPKDEELVKLTVSEVTHSIFYAPMYAAINNGYFKDAGIEIELIKIAVCRDGGHGKNFAIIFLFWCSRRLRKCRLRYR